MEIEKNIAVILQRALRESGKTKLEFSQELGIPRSSLQGYLDGTTCPRASAIETIAAHLSITPAQLVSGLDGVQDAALPGLEALRRMIPALHPQAQGIAEEAKGCPLSCSCVKDTAVCAYFYTLHFSFLLIQKGLPQWGVLFIILPYRVTCRKRWSIAATWARWARARSGGIFRIATIAIRAYPRCCCWSM